MSVFIAGRAERVGQQAIGHLLSPRCAVTYRGLSRAVFSGLTMRGLAGGGRATRVSV